MKESTLELIDAILLNLLFTRIVDTALSALFLNILHREYLGAIRSNFRVDLQHLINDVAECFGVLLRNRGNFSLQNFFIKTVHIIGSKWRLEGSHLVEDAP